MGPGLSLAVAEKFGSEGYTIGMVSRTEKKLAHYTHQLALLNVPAFYGVADFASTAQMIKAIKKLQAEMGGIHVLFYNAVDYRMKHILEETIEDLSNGFTISVGNVLEAVKELLPELEKNKGTVLLTGGGAANHPDANMGSISLGKAGIRNLAYQLNHSLSGKGIFVGTVTVSGWIDPDSITHAPAMIAEKFWDLFNEKQQVEIVY